MWNKCLYLYKHILKTAKMKDGKKTLNPQAAQYYKRLILVTDRYLILIGKQRKARTILWVTIMGLIVETLYLVKLKFPELAQLVMELIQK